MQMGGASRCHDRLRRCLLNLQERKRFYRTGTAVSEASFVLWFEDTILFFVHFIVVA